MELIFIESLIKDFQRIQQLADQDQSDSEYLTEEFFCKVRVLKEVCLELQYPAAPLLESLEPLHDDYYWLLDVPLKICKALLLKFERESEEKGFSVAV